ncbi:hypothetical protein THICB2_730197 [Thiomonas sp. CB2]|nr:hypothetical protein THICB2_730197 [Thiomonas sp. CB2]VDY06918.1 protein of unknown function [Thiomonas sp. Bio17B3]VDY09786.1 protein of unknown function [Thiomonas sp. Sup16B3]VDY15192.1 conserved protein of unknown function [Thiomonas sp. OC7]VDY15634.1 protein of unknown function [Thiomonas sp. CB2]
MRLCLRRHRRSQHCELLRHFSTPVDFLAANLRRLATPLSELLYAFWPSLAINAAFLLSLQLFQVLVVQRVCLWNELLVPRIVPGLIRPNQQNCRPAWIEGVQRSVWPPIVLCSQLSHVSMPRTLDATAVRHAQVRSSIFKQPDRRRD